MTHPLIQYHGSGTIDGGLIFSRLSIFVVVEMSFLSAQKLKPGPLKDKRSNWQLNENYRHLILLLGCGDFSVGTRRVVSLTLF